MVSGYDKPRHLNPWHPMTDPVDLKHLGKLAEELGEASATVARCIIQGINECDPETGKHNLLKLQEELSDVMTNISLVGKRFMLDFAAMEKRTKAKRAHLEAWHSME